MSDPNTPIDWGKWRKRIEHEDGLLNIRVNTFLVFNALGAVAFGLCEEHTAQIIIATFILVLDILLGVCTMQTAFVIKDLTLEFIDNSDCPIDKCVRRTLNKYPLVFLPTPILGMWLPFIVFVGWLVGLFILMAS